MRAIILKALFLKNITPAYKLYKRSDFKFDFEVSGLQLATS